MLKSGFDFHKSINFNRLKAALIFSMLRFYNVHLVYKICKLYLNCFTFFSYTRKKGKLRLKKKLLLLKVSKLKLEKLFFNLLKLDVDMHIKNIFTLYRVDAHLKLSDEAVLWRNWRLFFFEDLINIIYFSMFLRKSSILSLFIADNITNKKIHFNFLKKVKRLLNNFVFYGSHNSLVGILIKVHGKFQGRLRKRRFKYVFGKTSNTTLDTFVDYSLQKSYTKYGVFSIKVYLHFLTKDVD